MVWLYILVRTFLSSFLLAPDWRFVCVGSLYGAFQAYARALFAELIPMGEEARWYGLFSITDKVSAIRLPVTHR
jgi:MFS-type transporter involved in bile tolerance (Atg22 family)